MNRFKIIDKLVFKGFVGPYILFFFIVEFVLVMQFLWKYIDDILGKGFSVLELLQMIFYYGITIIPMAIPLTILISAVMVYGEMSEKFELVSMKSAGISLTRAFRAGMIIAFFTAGFSLFSSNYLKPIANFKFQTTFVSIKKKKPTLSIEEGIFNKDFKGYTIYVGKKGSDDNSIKDVLVYDHANAHNGEINVISANSGQMYSSGDGNYFIMKLFDGEHVKEIVDKKSKKKTQPLMRTRFKEWTKVFDMTVFNNAGSANIDRNKSDLLNAKQIMVAIDSINVDITENFDSGIHEYGKGVFNKKSTRNRPDPNKDKKAKKTKQFKNQIKGILKKGKDKHFQLVQRDSIANASTMLETLVKDQMRDLTISAHAKSKTVKDKLEHVARTNKRLQKHKNVFTLKLHQQFSWSIICIIFLFIGAPLGSIVKKGGFGFPVLIAISFFVIFILLLISGEKLSRAGTLSPEVSAWLPCIVLAPIAMLVTYVALKDLKFVDLIPRFRKLKISTPKELE